MTKEEMAKGLCKAQYYQQLSFGVLSAFHIFTYIDEETQEVFFTVYCSKNDGGASVHFYSNSDYKECMQDLHNMMLNYQLI